jgi:hypothetical protein
MTQPEFYTLRKGLSADSGGDDLRMLLFSCADVIPKAGDLSRAERSGAHFGTKSNGTAREIPRPIGLGMTSIFV